MNTTASRLATLGIAQVMGLAIRLLQVILFTRILSQADFGIYSALWAVLAWTTMLVMGGWPSVFIAGIPKHGLSHAIYRRSMDSLATRFAVIGSMQTLILLVFFRERYGAWAIFALAGALLFMSLGSSGVEAYRGLGGVIGSQVLFAFVPTLIAIALTTIGYVAGVTLTSAHAILYVSTGWLALWIAASVKVRRRCDASVEWNHPLRRNDFVLIKVSQGILSTADVFIVSVLVGVNQAALYAVATRVAVLAGFALSTVTMLYGPKLSAAALNRDLLKDLTMKATYLSLLGSAPIIATLALNRERILGAFGPQYEAASSILLILLVGTAANAVFGPIGTVVNVNGQERLSRNVMVTAAVVFVVADTVAAHTWGVYGAAWTWVIVTAAWNLTLWFTADLTHGEKRKVA